MIQPPMHTDAHRFLPCPSALICVHLCESVAFNLFGVLSAVAYSVASMRTPVAYPHVCTNDYFSAFFSPGFGTGSVRTLLSRMPSSIRLAMTGSESFIVTHTS